MPGSTTPKKITARNKTTGLIEEWKTTGAIDETSKPGYEKFNGRRIGVTPPETTDAAMWIEDAAYSDKKIEDVAA